MGEKNMAVSFVQYVLQQICENPDNLTIEAKDDERGTLIIVKVAESDMGKIIGKSGQTISALRTLLSVISAQQETKYFLKVIDPQES
jgi:predicted RNA-binding protein YlqC (UPF0109 family)